MSHPRLNPQKRSNKADYLSSDTIAAPITAIGGAVAGFRISGKESIKILQGLTRKTGEVEPKRATLEKIWSHKGKILDEALVIPFFAPSSYTGEDCVEFFTHGSQYVAVSLMEEFSRLGARPALPGEFGFRAVKNGKMDVSQAQAVADLIAADDQGAAELAIEKMSGLQSRRTRAFSEELKNTAALSELGIDFSDQDVDEVSLPRLKENAQKVLFELRTLEASFERGFRIQNGIQVAFVGLPNAGKSSFFNALLGEDRSIVTAIPGTTRDVVSEKLILSGKERSVSIRVEDTAGLRASSDEVEKIGIERSFRSARKADLVVCVVDPSSDLNQFAEAWDQLDRSPNEAMGLVTKTDLFPEWDLKTTLLHEKTKIKTWIGVSSVGGEGIQEAALEIAAWCEKATERKPGEWILTRQEQLEAVRSAIEHLERAMEANQEEFFAADLKQALHALSPLIGETLPDDILGKIFSQFCIGK